VNRLLPLLAIGLLAGCGGAKRATPVAGAGADTAHSDTSTGQPTGAHAGAALVDTTLPPMPDYPKAEHGELTVEAVGDLAEKIGWPARAGRCRQPAMLQVLAQDPTQGLLVLLELPDSGEVTGTYPVSFTQEGLPTAPAAQLALERLDPKAGPGTYQALDGTVELSQLDAEASGRFAVTLRNLSTDAQSQIAGTFQGLPVIELDSVRCARALPKDTSKADSAKKPSATPKKR